MQVLINNFRGVEKAEYKFNDQLILINGPSGIGKSTIFNAITWCLYGNLRNVDPYGTIKPKVCVIIKGLASLTITRKKNPGLLKVIREGKEYEDDVAQELIDSTIGPLDLWNITTYIPQGERNKLLTASNADKMDILRQLAFPEGNPEKEIEKIDTHVKKANMQVESQKLVLQSVANEKSKLTEDDGYSSELLKSVENEIGEVKNELIVVRDKHVNNEKKRAVFNSLKEQEKKIKEEIEKIEYFKGGEEEEIEKLEEEVLTARSADAALELKRKIDKLKKEIDTLNIKTGEIREVKDDEIIKAKQIEAQYEKALSVCKSLNIELNKEEIEETIEQLEKMVNIQPYLNAKIKIRKLVKDLSDLPSEKMEKSKSVDELTQLLYSAKARSKLHSCPNCTASLAIDNNGNLKVSKDKPSTDKEIKEIEKEIKKVKEQEEINKSRKEIEEKIKMLKETLPKEDIEVTTVLNESQIKIAKNKINALRGINTFTNVKVSSKELSNMKRYNELSKELEELEMRYRPYETLTLKEKVESINNLEKRISVLRSNKAKRIEKNKILRDIENKICTITLEPSYQNAIEELEERLNKYEEKREKLKKSKEYMEVAKRFEEEKAKFEIYLNKYNLMEKLKTKAILAQNKMLEDTVNLINVTLRDIGNQLFPSPISIKIELFKRTKTTNQLRSQVNFTINYKGNEYTSLDALSGGEADRVSLAVTIALNRISASPFLMLDECMASLDQDIREQCLESLRLLIGKIVLLVNHDGVEGNFDSVTKVS